MIKRAVYILILCCCALGLHAQDAYEFLDNANREYTNGNIEQCKNWIDSLVASTPDEPEVIAQGMLIMAKCQRADNKPTSAINTLKEATTLDLVESDILGEVYEEMGIIYSDEDSPELAMDYFFEAYKIFKEHDRLESMARINFRSGTIYRDALEYGAASSRFSSALEYYQAIEEYPKVAACHEQLALTYERSGDVNAAYLHYNQAAATYHGIGLTSLQLEIIDKQITLALSNNMLDEAASMSEKATDICLAQKGEKAANLYKARHAEILEKKKDLQEAVRIQKEVVAELRNGESAPLIKGLIQLGHYQKGAGRQTDALLSFHEAHKIRRKRRQ